MLLNAVFRAEKLVLCTISGFKAIKALGNVQRQVIYAQLGQLALKQTFPCVKTHFAAKTTLIAIKRVKSR